MKNKLIIAIFLIALVGAAVAGLNSEDKNSASPQISETQKQENLGDWEKYSSRGLGVSFNYPSDFKKNDHPDGTVTVFKAGPTQTEGTEFYDGVSINFSKNAYSGDFKNFVESERKKRLEDPIFKNVGEAKEVGYAGKKGYKFSVNSLGKFTLIFLPVSETKYLQISLLVEDPKALGFESTAEGILASLSIN